MGFFTQLYLLCAGVMSGVILFQSSIVASSIFKILPEENAGLLLRNLFPKFFLFLISLAILSTISAFLSDLNFVPFGLIELISFLAMLICYLIIPKTNQARDEKKDSLFAKLHTVSVSLTLLVLILNISMMIIALFIAKKFVSGVAQQKCIALECGLQNGTLAVFVSTLIFDEIAYFVPTAAYALIMYITGFIFIYILRKSN